MSWLNIWSTVPINRSNRPILQEEEYTLYIKDNIGLYQGKSKILEHQNGRLYLTNKRIIYFDNDDQKRSIGVDLENFSSAEFVDRFLRSSPKVKLFIKNTDSSKKSHISSSSPLTGINGFPPISSPSSTQSTASKRTVNWVCKICSFNNSILSNFNFEENELPKCTSCGIRPNKIYLQDTIKNSKESASPTPSISPVPSTLDSTIPTTSTRRDDQCPQCTFINHPSMRYCEICGTELKSTIPKALQMKISESMRNNSASPKPTNSNPLGLKLENEEAYTNNQPYIKISFRKGGENQFFQQVGMTIDEIKWEKLKNKGGINKNAVKLSLAGKVMPVEPTKPGFGIHALEQLGQQQRKQNELILSSSLDDLEQLMLKYQDLIKLSSSFNKFINNKKSTTTAVTTTTNKQLIPSLNIKKTSTLYHQELSRHISEYTINYVLLKASSMITSQDLFANYNRFLVQSQGFGCELVTANDFNKSISMFEELKLPIVLRNYEKSGLLVIAPKSTKNTYAEYIVNYLREEEYQFKMSKMRHVLIINEESQQDGYYRQAYTYFKGNTVSEISNKLNWSNNITIEELDKCVNEGLVVIDQNISGTFYYINKFTFTSKQWDQDEKSEIDEIRKILINEQKTITENLKDEYEREHLNNLINLDPNYAFGDLVEPESSDVSRTDTPVQESHSISLNDLAGLKF
ncbi:VPS36 [[Candida] subhashii]|uniref:Vacuolar protein-sorting-associated protein 36 n=1 Tax=[Candida] subhashii TaxID=561895 RepID=A0A8J5QFN0_9ASCO|nr:VPS36 [[Candida] subhashii]KAG7660548.1 VPS36 [[Candida] subhashii]